MRSTWTLPEGYEQKYLIDLKDNKKQFWIVNGLSIVIMLLLLAAFCQLMWHGFLELHFEGLSTQVLVMALGTLAYIPPPRAGPRRLHPPLLRQEGQLWLHPGLRLRGERVLFQ